MLTHERMIRIELEQRHPDSVVLKLDEMGNPDFLIIPKEAIPLLHFVEAKDETSRVRSDQLTAHQRLRGQGFRVDVIRPSSFAPIPDQLCKGCGKPLSVCKECEGEMVCIGCEDACSKA